MEQRLTLMDASRRQLLRVLKKSNGHPRTGSAVPKAVTDPSFPMSFFLRNVASLKADANWRALSPRLQKSRIRRLFRERSRFHLEVKRWKAARGELAFQPPVGKDELADGYCNHCGWCCEICSGYPDFPPSSEITQRWKDIFGNGLGKGHRFCAFLWEWEGGRSLCSIHPHRSNPCRVFEREECDFLMKDPEVRDPSAKRRLIEVRQWFIHLIDGR